MGSNHLTVHHLFPPLKTGNQIQLNQLTVSNNGHDQLSKAKEVVRDINMTGSCRTEAGSNLREVAPLETLKRIAIPTRQRIDYETPEKTTIVMEETQGTKVGKVG